MLLIHERQIIGDSEGRQETVLVYGMRHLSFKGKFSGHPRQNKPRGAPGQQQEFESRSRGAPPKKIVGTCFYCYKLGHMQRDCRNCIEDEKRGIQRTIAFSASTVAADGNDWIIDSGATRHLTPNGHLLYKYRSVEPNTAVLFVNGQQAKAAGQAGLSLEVMTTSGTKTVLLLYVLHVQEATASLFSARQAMEGSLRLCSETTDAK